MAKAKIELGARVRDSITGFEGVVTGRAEYLHGGPRVCIEGPAVLGKTSPLEWTEETRLEVVVAENSSRPPPTPAAPAEEKKKDAAPPNEAKTETVTKENGKKMDPEEQLETAKKLFLELAQKTSREHVVGILETFGAAKLGEVPVVKLPEFIKALEAEIKKAK